MSDLARRSPDVAKADDAVNETIDEVAREMTAGEPAGAAGFRRRVLARIERGDTPRRTWRASFVLSPIAVVAAVAIAIFIAREPSKGIPSAPDRAAAAPVVPSRTAGPEEPARQADLVSPPPRPAEARAPQGRAEAEPPPEANDVASITVAPLAVGALTQESIQLERLEAIAPITVAPLDITDSSRRIP
jgi:hypothetical protein